MLKYYFTTSKQRSEEKTKIRNDYFRNDAFKKDILSYQAKIRVIQTQIENLDTIIKKSKEDLDKISTKEESKIIRARKEYEINNLLIDYHKAKLSIYHIKKIEADLNVQMLNNENLYLDTVLQKNTKNKER